MFSGRYYGLAGRMVTLRVSTAEAKGVTTGTLLYVFTPPIRSYRGNVFQLGHYAYKDTISRSSYEPKEIGCGSVVCMRRSSWSGPVELGDLAEAKFFPSEAQHKFIPFLYSFDVIVGIDWLSKRKFVIVCHEKVVEIPLEGSRKLRVQGERTLGAAKALMNAKVDEPKVGRVKLRRVRAMSMTIQSSVKDKILATSSETSKVENAPAKMLHDLDQQMEKRADDGKANVVTDALSRKERVKPRRVRAMAMTIQYGVRGMILTAQSEAFKLRWTIYPVLLADAAESVRDAIGFEYCLASSSGWTKVACSMGRDWESSLTGLELVPETTDKVTSWKRVVCFEKKGKLASRYVGPFEFLERIDPVAYRLRLPKELSGVHDTFHVSNLKRCLADTSLHVPLDEIKVDKTLHFVEEPVEIIDREVKSLKCSRISLVKVR
ncbi:hypothetical protein Tco_0139353 [Tanacetum coccineum]